MSQTVVPRINHTQYVQPEKKECVFLCVCTYLSLLPDQNMIQYGFRGFNKSLALLNCYKTSLINREINSHRGKIIVHYVVHMYVYFKCVYMCEWVLHNFNFRIQIQKKTDFDGLMKTALIRQLIGAEKDNAAIHQCSRELIPEYDNAAFSNSN